MIPQINITPSIYYVGVNDRTKDLFESMWPLPHGVSYNSYLIVDEKITLRYLLLRAILPPDRENHWGSSH